MRYAAFIFWRKMYHFIRKKQFFFLTLDFERNWSQCCLCWGIEQWMPWTIILNNFQNTQTDFHLIGSYVSHCWNPRAKYWKWFSNFFFFNSCRISHSKEVIVEVWNMKQITTELSGFLTLFLALCFLHLLMPLRHLFRTTGAIVSSVWKPLC